MPDYLKVDDFLANDPLMSKKIGSLRDSVDAVRGQVDSLTMAFTNYVAETDAYRIANDKRLDGIDARLAGVDGRLDKLEQAVNTLAQTVSQGFTLIFARLGIQA